MSDTLTCPHCNHTITITEALSKQLKQDAQKAFETKLAQMQKQTQTKEKELEKKTQALAAQKAKLQDELDQKLEQQTQILRQELWKKAQHKATEQTSLELKDLKAQLKEKQQAQADFEEKELQLRKQARELEEQQKQQQLKLERQLDQERQKIKDQTEKELQEQSRLKLLEKDKQIADMKKLVEEAQRKAAQGSQQNQGEVLELDLENSLSQTFKHDHIKPVGKGVSGADILQIVCTNAAQACGTILWEIKQTKHWTEKWVAKFKDDLRAQKANLPVLVTTALPKDIRSFGHYQGIWVTQPEHAIPLATALRRLLLDTAYERQARKGKGAKQELLYNYVASHEFRQRVEALVEVYQDMQTQIDKERTAFERSWSQRSTQLKRLMLSTAGMYGEMQGLVGAAMPTIKGLELDSSKQPQNQLPESEPSLFDTTQKPKQKK